MLRSVFLFGLATVISGCAARFVSYSGRQIQNVYPVKGASKDSIYFKAKLWLAESFENSKNGIVLDDPQNGIIISKTSIQMPCGGSSFDCVGLADDKMIFGMKIEARDERFKMSISDIYRVYGNNVPSIAGQRTDQMIIADTTTINNKLANFGASLQSFISSPKTNDSW